jgi:nucleoprotein TPR
MKENNTKEMEIELEDDDESGADAIITKRLVVFKNIQELQNQNEALLRSIRSLSAKMEAQELKEQTEMEQKSTAALNESAALIEDLQLQLKRELLNSESYCRERDTWRRIAESKSVTDPSERIVQEKTSLNDMASYKELQREFDIYRKECGTDTKLLKDQLDLVQHEKTELTIQVAKLNNQIGYLNGII